MQIKFAFEKKMFVVFILLLLVLKALNFGTFLRKNQVKLQLTVDLSIEGGFQTNNYVIYQLSFIQNIIFCFEKIFILVFSPSSKVNIHSLISVVVAVKSEISSKCFSLTFKHWLLACKFGKFKKKYLVLVQV